MGLGGQCGRAALLAATWPAPTGRVTRPVCKVSFRGSCATCSGTSAVFVGGGEFRTHLGRRLEREAPYHHRVCGGFSGVAVRAFVRARACVYVRMRARACTCTCTSWRRCIHACALALLQSVPRGQGQAGN